MASPFRSWPVLRQLMGDDRLGRRSAAKSHFTESLRPRTATADEVVKSVCPYCAVGCGMLVYQKDGKIIQIEGDLFGPRTPTDKTYRLADVKLFRRLAMDEPADDAQSASNFVQ